MLHFWLLIQFIIVVGGGGLLLAAGWVQYRQWEQKKMDSDRITYELSLPGDLDIHRAALLFANLSGAVRQPVRVARRNLPTVTGYRAIVFEVFSTDTKIMHLLSFPRSLERSVQASLAGTIPNAGYQAVQGDFGDFTAAIELVPADVTYDPHENHTGALLASFTGLRPGEALLAQFVMHPVPFIESRSDRPVFDVVGRVAARGSRPRALGLLKDLLFQYNNLRVFVASKPLHLSDLHRVNDRRTPSSWPGRLSAQGVAVVCGLVLKDVNVPGFDVNRKRHLAPSSSIPEEGVRLGVATTAGAHRQVATTIDRMMTHQWIIGRTEHGKSTLMLNQAAQIMDEGASLILIEPDGRLAESVLDAVPGHRAKDVIWFDPTDTARPIGFNLLHGPDPERTAGYVVHLFKSLYGDSWGPRLEQILSYSTLTAALHGLTIYDVKQLLVNHDFRTRILKQTHHTEVKQFWRRLEDGPDNAVDAVINKLDALLRSETLRNIVGQTDGLDIGQILREGKILLVPLPSEDLGAPNAAMLGGALVSRIWSEVRLRKEGVPVVLMMDEWQEYMQYSTSLSTILDQARKYRLGLVGANQRVNQLSDEMLSAVQANALTKVAFSVSPEDAKRVAGHFAPMEPINLASLEKYEAAMSIAVPGGIAPTVTVRTNPPPMRTGAGWIAREHSRATYGVPVEDVRAAHRNRHSAVEKPDKPKFGRRAE